LKIEKEGKLIEKKNNKELRVKFIFFQKWQNEKKKIFFFINETNQRVSSKRTGNVELQKNKIEI